MNARPASSPRLRKFRGGGTLQSVLPAVRPIGRRQFPVGGNHRAEEIAVADIDRRQVVEGRMYIVRTLSAVRDCFSGEDEAMRSGPSASSRGL